ncbi:MAG: DUF664 domain-containing protein [Acidimicrobiales bacterium]
MLGILEGLDDEQLRRVVLPSEWSPLDMVKHLALDLEHYWPQCIVAGESLDFFSTDGHENAWRVGPDKTPASSGSPWAANQSLSPVTEDWALASTL